VPGVRRLDGILSPEPEEGATSVPAVPAHSAARAGVAPPSTPSETGRGRPAVVAAERCGGAGSLLGAHRAFVRGRICRAARRASRVLGRHGHGPSWRAWRRRGSDAVGKSRDHIAFLPRRAAVRPAAMQVRMRSGGRYIRNTRNMPGNGCYLSRNGIVARSTSRSTGLQACSGRSAEVAGEGVPELLE